MDPIEEEDSPPIILDRFAFTGGPLDKDTPDCVWKEIARCHAMVYDTVKGKYILDYIDPGSEWTMQRRSRPNVLV